MKSLEPVVRKLKDTSQFDQAENIFEKEVTLVDKLKEMIKLDATDLLHHKDSFLQFRKKARSKMKKNNLVANSGVMNNSALRSSSCKSTLNLPKSSGESVQQQEHQGPWATESNAEVDPLRIERNPETKHR
jgi:hypothetical protein